MITGQFGIAVLGREMHARGKHIGAIADPVLELAGSPQVALFHEQVEAAKAKTVARGIDLAAGDFEVLVVTTRDRIVAGPEVAVADRKTLAGLRMNAVVAASHNNFLDAGTRAITQQHGVVRRAGNRDPLDHNIAAVG